MSEAIPPLTEGATARRLAAAAAGQDKLSGAKVEVDRPSRVDFSGQRLRLFADPIQGYHLCFVNDTPDNIHGYSRNGYQFVLADEQKPDPMSERFGVKGDDPGTRVRRFVGTNEDGSAMYAYLMKVEDSLFDEGMASIEERNNAVQRDITRRITEGRVPGESNFYASKGNSIKVSKQKP